MSTKVPQNKENEEIDLFQISKKIGDFFENIKTRVFNGIQFFVKNWIVVLLLIGVGFGAGLYLDKNKTSYSHQIIVTPNFGSTDYLYAKINLIESKIVDGDTVFLNGIGITNPSLLNKIEVKPIVDVYKFVNSNEQNLELLQLMAQNGDLKTVVKDSTTSKNYNYHTITVSTKGITNSKNSIQPILNYLNTNGYFDEVQKISVNNIQQNIKTKEGIITQIDGVLNNFSSSNEAFQKSDKLVYYNENTQLNDIIKTKDSLTKEIGSLKLKLFDSKKTIKDRTTIMNIKNNKSIYGKLRFVLPFVLISIFIFIRFFLSFYRKQSLKSEQNQL